MNGLLARPRRADRAWTNYGDTIVFGERGPRHREYTAVPVCGPTPAAG